MSEFEVVALALLGGIWLWLFCIFVRLSQIWKVIK
jgi:hypothetical protein